MENQGGTADKNLTEAPPTTNTTTTRIHIAGHSWELNIRHPAVVRLIHTVFGLNSFETESISLELVSIRTQRGTDPSCPNSAGEHGCQTVGTAVSWDQHSTVRFDGGRRPA